MKTIKLLTIAAFLASGFACHAITNTAIAVSGTNIVLSWPSQGYEQYLVQYRHALDPFDSWSTFTNAYPAGTNLTTLRVAASPGMNAGGGNGAYASMANIARPSLPPVPMAIPANGTGGAVPLALYPPGIDMSGFIIFDPVSGESMSWSEYSASPLALSPQQFNGPEPQDGDGGGTGDPTPEPEIGFYRVFHIPSFPAGITNYIFDGPIFIPVDFADYRERVENIEVLIDGEPTTYADYMSLFYNGQTNWGMGIYFDRISNGTHQIQLVSTLKLNAEADDEATFLVLSNLTRSVVVDNQVTFTNWDDMAWNNTNYTFRAQTKNINTDWVIDIYDAWGLWINGNSGHTTDGQIEWTWDLRDYSGNLRDDLGNDPFFDPWITLDEAGAAAALGGNEPAPAAAQTSRPMPVPVISYPSIGAWLISFQNTFYDAGTSSNEKMVDCMRAIQGWVEFRDVPTLLFPVAYGTNDNYTQAERDGDWLTVKSELARPDSRNFYYFGHGNSNSIGGDLNSYDTNGVITGSQYLPNSKAYLASSTVKSEVTFNNSTGVHHYRFVWLDGCNTALGNWPGAFGVNKGTNDLAYYNNGTNNPSHQRPSAFVGWATKPGGPGWGTVTGFFFCRSEWITSWSYNMNTKPLNQALEDGRHNSDWIQQAQFEGGIRVYGYNVLKMNEYNKKTDWPTP
ncbi:MAG: hypothetical protein PHY43_04635 [Verrucomicrobiales bacterium]|nr:hypothetical protein [Verrucomicrobiales bacterium]